jgi:hypothetical protein
MIVTLSIRGELPNQHLDDELRGNATKSSISRSGVESEARHESETSWKRCASRAGCVGGLPAQNEARESSVSSSNKRIYHRAESGLPKYAGSAHIFRASERDGKSPAALSAQFSASAAKVSKALDFLDAPAKVPPSARTGSSPRPKGKSGRARWLSPA